MILSIFFFHTNPFSSLISGEVIGFGVLILSTCTYTFFAINIIDIIFNRKGDTLSAIKILIIGCLFGILPGGLYFITGIISNYFHPIEKYGLFVLVTYFILTIGIFSGFVTGCSYHIGRMVKLKRKECERK